MIIFALGVLLLVIVAFMAGRQVDRNLSDNTFSAMIACGILVVKTDDGWLGEPEAFDEIVKRVLLAKKSIPRDGQYAGDRLLVNNVPDESDQVGR
jgi:hypothetical protein